MHGEPQNLAMAFLRKELISLKQKTELHTEAENELAASMQTGKIDSRGLFSKNVLSMACCSCLFKNFA